MNNYSDDINASETIVWENLTVSVPIRCKGPQKGWRKFVRRSRMEPLTILQGVSGYATTGNLIAVMGPSGAGKTTFLSALAKRMELTKGAVKLNGRILSKEVMLKISSYMPQFDALPPSLTVEEYILFAHALKLNSTATERKFQTSNLLIDLGLLDCKNSLISTLSGGEKKRVSLATELVTKPKILFLDEPTTGLDTFSAIRVIESLKIISLSGTIVFCTIHQPGMAAYNLFSHVILMTDGRIACFGSLNDITQFFSSQGYNCPIGFDESEYYIKIISNVIPSNLNEEEPASSERIDKICQAFLHSSFARIPEIAPSAVLEYKLQKRAGCVLEFYWLLWRTWTQSRRTFLTNWVSWISYFLSVAMVGVFYAGINPRTQEGVQNARGALYMMSSEIIFTVAYSVIYEFPFELLIYVRESSIYGSGPYFIATFFGLLPSAITKALLFTTVLYFILTVGFDPVNFLFYYLITTIAAICGTAYGIMFSSWIEDIEITTAIMVPIDMLCLLSAGVFYNLSSLPLYLSSLKYLSLFFYVNEALSVIYWPRIDKIECRTNSELPCLSDGKEVLSEYGFKEGNFWWDLGGLGILTISMAFVGFLGTYRRRRIKTML